MKKSGRFKTGAPVLSQVVVLVLFFWVVVVLVVSSWGVTGIGSLGKGCWEVVR